MRLFIIGRLYEKNNRKAIAYKLYDANKKVTGVYDSEEVRARVRQGILVVGLTVLTGLNSDYVLGVHSSYNISKTDILNGKGIAINPTGMYVLVGHSGYLEDTRYRLVNSNGYEKIVNQEEFKKLVDEDKVNGAVKSNKIKDKINIYKHCNCREYNY